MAGCIALKPHDATTAELKRLYVRPAARGRDLGRLLVTTLLDEARAVGYRRLVLDSHHTMRRAHAIYEAAGFSYVPEPDDFPEHLRGVAVFMELDLAEPSGGRA